MNITIDELNIQILSDKLKRSLQYPVMEIYRQIELHRLDPVNRITEHLIRFRQSLAWTTAENLRRIKDMLQREFVS